MRLPTKATTKLKANKNTLNSLIHIPRRAPY